MIPIFDANYIVKHLKNEALIDALKDAFKKNEIIFPEKNYYDLSPNTQGERIVINMPSWDKQYFGVKLISVFSKNEQKWRLPQIQGFYCLIDAIKGSPLCYMDAGEITKIRTACTSALASKFLSRPESKTLLVLGTGALSPYMIQAHSAARPIERVFIWGRNFEKAKTLSDTVTLRKKIHIEAIEDYTKVISEVDIISSVTSSPTPLIFSNHIRKGQHLDLVGAFTPTTAEAESGVVAQSSVYVDELRSTPKKAGEIAIALKQNKITKEDIKGDLYNLCGDDQIKRKAKDEITLFKSVGLAIEDFVAAALLWEEHRQLKNITIPKFRFQRIFKPTKL